MVYATLNSHALFYFGLLLTDVLTLAIIVAVVHPASSWNRWLGVQPLRGIGLRSYGIYLWGVVVLEFTRPGVDVHWSSPVLFVVRLVLIAGLVELSYRYIEMPVRRGALEPVLPGAPHQRRRPPDHNRPALDGCRCRGPRPGGAARRLCRHRPAEQGDQRRPDEDRWRQRPADEPRHAPAGSEQHSAVSGHHAQHQAEARRVLPVPASAQFAGYPKVWSKGYIVTAIGDSVMLGANLAPPGKPGLLQRSLGHIVGPGVWVNVVEGRQASLCADYLQLLQKDHQLGPIVIVHCGNNGTISNHFVSDVMHIAGPKRHVMFMTDKVERWWEIPNNQLIESQAKQYKNAKVLDWYFFGTHANQNAIFDSEDNGGLKLHLTQPYGATFYTNLVINTLRKWGWLPYTAAP